MKYFALAVFLCFLASCCQQKGWIYSEVVSDGSQFDSNLLMHVPSNQFSGIEVQILTGEFGRVGYLCVYRHITNPTFVFQIDDHQYIYEGIIMEGNQRMQIPDKATELLITALLNNQSILIYFDSFSTYLNPENFGKKYKNLKTDK